MFHVVQEGAAVWDNELTHTLSEAVGSGGDNVAELVRLGGKVWGACTRSSSGTATGRELELDCSELVESLCGGRNGGAFSTIGER